MIWGLALATTIWSAGLLALSKLPAQLRIEGQIISPLDPNEFSKFYIDRGTGYSEREAFDSFKYPKTGPFLIGIDLEEVAAIQRVRFDPVNNQKTRIRISRIQLNTFGYSEDLDLSQLRGEMPPDSKHIAISSQGDQIILSTIAEDPYLEIVDFQKSPSLVHRLWLNTVNFGWILLLVAVALIFFYHAKSVFTSLRKLNLKDLALVTSLTALLFGIVEISVRFLIDKELIERPVAMKTLVKGDDFRDWHIVGDQLRERDPELGWIPKAESPYNKQRFRGAVLNSTKLPNEFRIFAYGDSNTDGDIAGSWPEELAKEFGDKKKVINAGVAGYSSQQGLLRLKREADMFKPDLVLFSFGWNDVAKATSSDHMYEPMNTIQYWILKYAMQLDSVLVLNQALSKGRQLSDSTQVNRVSIKEYGSNILEASKFAAAKGFKIVFLTRPHRLSIDELRKSDGWRSEVPDYNQALRDLAVSSSIDIVDVENVFDGRPEFFSDECHFDNGGKKKMSQFIYSELQRLNMVF